MPIQEFVKRGLRENYTKVVKYMGSATTDDDIKELIDLLEHNSSAHALNINGARLTNACLKDFKRLPSRIKRVNLEQCDNFTDDCRFDLLECFRDTDRVRIHACQLTNVTAALFADRGTHKDYTIKPNSYIDSEHQRAMWRRCMRNQGMSEKEIEERIAGCERMGRLMQKWRDEEFRNRFSYSESLLRLQKASQEDSGYESTSPMEEVPDDDEPIPPPMEDVPDDDEALVPSTKAVNSILVKQSCLFSDMTHHQEKDDSSSYVSIHRVG